MLPVTFRTLFLHGQNKTKQKLSLFTVNPALRVPEAKRVLTKILEPIVDTVPIPFPLKSPFNQVVLSFSHILQLLSNLYYNLYVYLASEETDTTNQATMWLGTEDGCIHIYHCGENIRLKKNRTRIQQGAAVLCLV